MQAESKKKARYWGPETEQAVIEFNLATDAETRNRIYEERLHAPFSKLVECIFNRFKFGWHQGGYCKGDARNLKEEALGHLVANIDKFSCGKGKAYSYASVIAKNYFIGLNQREYVSDTRGVPLAEMLDEEGDFLPSAVLSYEDRPHVDYPEFVRGLSPFLGECIPFLFSRSEQKIVAQEIVNTLAEAPDFHFKKEFYAYMVEKTGAHYQTIRKARNKLGECVKEAFRSYLDTGVINLSVEHLFNVPQEVKKGTRKGGYNSFGRKGMPDEMAEAIAEAYKKGGKIKDIAAQFNCGVITVLNVARRAGIEKRQSRELTESEREEIVNAFLLAGC